MVIGEKMDINSLRGQVRRILMELGPPSEVLEKNPEVDIPGTTPVSLSGAKYATEFGYSTFLLTPAKTNEILKTLKEDIEENGGIFNPRNEGVMTDVFETLDAVSVDPMSKTEDEVRKALDYAVITMLLACGSGNEGEGFTPSDGGVPMMDSDDVPVKSRDSIKKFIEAAARKRALDTEDGLERMFGYAINGLKKVPLLGKEYMTSRGEIKIIPKEMLQADIDAVKTDFGIQEASFTAAVGNAGTLASNLEAAGKATYEGSSATEYEGFLDAVVRCYDMPPVIATGPFSGIDRSNESISSEWQVASLIRLAAKREESDYDDAVSSTIWSLVGAAAAGAIAGYGGTYFKDKFANIRLDRIRGALRAGSSGNTAAAQQIDELLNTPRVKEALEAAGKSLLERQKAISETLATLKAERERLTAELQSISTATRQKTKAAAELRTLLRKQGELEDRLRTLEEAIIARVSGTSPAGGPSPVVGPGGAPIITTRSSAGGSGGSAGSTASALEKQIESVRRSKADLEGKLEAYQLAIESGLTPAQQTEYAARRAAIMAQYDAQIDQLQNVIDLNKETSLARFNRLMDEKDMQIMSAALNDKPPFNRLGLLGITAAVGIAMAGGATGGYIAALEKAIDELPFDDRGAFILLAMTQEQYRDSDFYIDASSSNYYNEMDGEVDKAGIRDYIRDIFFNKSGSKRRLSDPEAEAYYYTILAMIRGCLGETLDTNAVRKGYIACLEILGQVTPTQSKPSDLTQIPRIGPTVRVKTGAGFDVPAGVKRQ